VTVTRARILWPREHGTYGELLFPLLAALLLARPDQAAWALSLVAAGGFLAHEGLSVLVGTRGVRAQRDDRGVAWRSVVVFGGAALIAAAGALPALTSATLGATGIAASLSMASVAVAWFGREHTLAGELMAVIALSSWCVPVGLAGGMALPVATALWLIWTAAFGLATSAVHLVIARRSPRLDHRAGAIGWLIGAATPAALWMFVDAGHLPARALMIPIPAQALFLVLAAAPVRATHLRRIGWSVIGVSALTLALMAGAIP